MQKMCAVNLIFAYKDFRVIVSENNKNLMKLNEKSNFICNCAFNHYLTLPDGFTAKDEDFFITLLYYARKNRLHKGKNEIILSFEELKKFLNEKSYKKNNNRFNKEICNFIDKIIKINGLFSIETQNDKYKEKEPFFLFEKIAYDEQNKQVIFKISKKGLEFMFILENFLQLNLKELCNLKLKSSKALYRLLIQFKNIRSDEKNVKTLNLNIKEFRSFFKLSATYRPAHIENKILTPAIKELENKKYFNSIYYEKIINSANINNYYQIKFDDTNRLK